MKIEALETFLDGRNRYEKGDVRTVLDENGEYFCSCGWARDVDGNVETAERQKNGDVRLDIRKGYLNQKAGEV